MFLSPCRTPTPTATCLRLVWFGATSALPRESVLLPSTRKSFYLYRVVTVCSLGPLCAFPSVLVAAQSKQHLLLLQCVLSIVSYLVYTTPITSVVLLPCVVWARCLPSLVCQSLSSPSKMQHMIYCVVWTRLVPSLVSYCNIYYLYRVLVGPCVVWARRVSFLVCQFRCLNSSSCSSGISCCVGLCDRPSVLVMFSQVYVLSILPQPCF